jgi:hypothetical protein
MITSGTQSVGTTAVAIDGVAAAPSHIHIRNNDQTKNLFVGGPNVTTANGLPIDKLTTVEFDLPAGEQMWMISTENGHTVSWLRLVQ